MATYAEPNQKTAQVDDTIQVLSPRFSIPANPPVPIPELQGRCAEPQSSKPAMFRADQVAHLCTNQRTRPSGVLLEHQLVPDTDLGIGLYPDQLKFLNLFGSCRKVLGFFYWLRQSSGFCLRGLPSGFRQLKSPDPLQLPKGFKATAFLWVAQSIEEIKVLAHPLCNGGARGIHIVFQYLLDDNNRFRM